MNAHTQPCPTCQSSYYQKQIKVKIGQSDLILTLNCVTMSKWVLQIKKKQQIFDVLVQHHCFAIFSLMFFPIFSKVFNNILKIYKLSIHNILYITDLDIIYIIMYIFKSIHTKIPKYSQTLILIILIYQANTDQTKCHK